MGKRAWLGIVAMLLLSLLAPGEAGAQPGRDRPRSPKHPVLATSLLDEAGLVSASALLGGAEQPQIDARGRIAVELRGDDAALEAAVAAVGGEVDSRVPGILTAFVAPSRLADLAAEPGVQAIREPMRMKALETSAGVAETGMSAWHVGGEDGAGVTVGIVDIGFQGYTALLSTDLPPSVQTIDDCEMSGFQGDDHGTAVAEIVHDMAPGAALVLACVETEVDLGEVSATLQAMGVRIVNASIGCSICARGDGTGTSGDAVRTSRLANTLWTVSAGNEGDGHYSFTGTTRNAVDSVLFGPNDPLFVITLPAFGQMTIEAKWDAWPLTNQDYDLFLYDNLAAYPQSPIAGSIFPQDGDDPPVEGFTFTNPSAFPRNFYLEIFAFSDVGIPPANPAGRRFDIYVTGNVAAQEAVTGGSISEPATSPYVMTVGAYDVTNGQLEPFSSRGPTIDGRVKPDIAGPDNVATEELNPFLGTSAAAPHVAGAAAVLLGANSTLDAAELQAVIEGRSLDSGSQGLDNGFGFGRLRLGPVGTPEPPAGDLYVGVNPPVRVVDTRLCDPRCVLGPGQEVDLAVAGQMFGGVAVPADASAIAFNVTAVAPTGGGFITVYPNGQTRPTVSNLNTTPGQTRANNVTARVGGGGRIRFFNSSGNTNLVVDLAGYYAPRRLLK